MLHGEVNMQIFEAPVINVIALNVADIITTSILDTDDDGFNNEVVKP